MADAELRVDLKADASGFERAVTEAAGSLDELKKNVDNLDSEQLDIPIKLELDRVNRDLATLGKALDGIERRKATADADLDITQLLREEDRVRKAMDKLDSRKVEIEAELDADLGGFAALRGQLAALDGELGNVVPGLGRFAGALKGPAGVIGGTLLLSAVLLKTYYNLGLMAAEVETAKVQLESLTGSAEAAEKVFSDLQQFAAGTPFTFSELTQASKYLIAAGTDAAFLQQSLEDIGEVAAAVGVPIADIAFVFQQMYNKGKVSNEELLQLAERGVPAYQLLADELGVTTQEVAKMAERSELGTEAIDKLRESLGETYSGSIARQAETFNGQLSTFNDTIEQIGQNAGRVFLPVMKDILTVLNFFGGYARDAVKWLADLNDEFQILEKTPFIGTVLQGFGLIADRIRDTDSATNSLTGRFQTLSLEAQGLDRPGATSGTVVSLEDLESAADDAYEALDDLKGLIAEIGGRKRSKVEIAIDLDQSLDDLREQIEGTEDEPGISLPADLKVGQIAALPQAEQDFIRDVNDRIGDQLEAIIELNPNITNEELEAELERIRDENIELLIDAGLDPDAAARLVAQAGGLGKDLDPLSLGIDLDTGRAELALARVQERIATTLAEYETLRSELEGAATTANTIQTDDGDLILTQGRVSSLRADLDTINNNPQLAALETRLETLQSQAGNIQVELGISDPQDVQGTLDGIDGSTVNADVAVSSNAGEISVEIDGAAAPRDSTINVSAPNASAVGSTLDEVARDRSTRIVPFIDPASLINVYRQFLALDDPIYKPIILVTRGGGGGGGGGDEGAAFSGRLLRAARNLEAVDAGPYFSSTAAGRAEAATASSASRSVEVKPKRSAVKVYLDGAEIASHLDLQADRLVAATSRRTA